VTKFKRTETRKWTYSTVLDNHEPPRTYHNGVLTEWEREEDPDSPTMVLEPDSPFFELHIRASGGLCFILDNGSRAIPFYVTGYQPASREVFLQPFPTNPNGRTRPDGQIIDFSNWVLGPRKTYHLKLSTPAT